MGQVWKAEADVGMGVSRYFALKFVDSGGVDAELFQDEVAVLAALHHPNLIELIEAGRHEDTFWLAMEWVPGVSLEKLSFEGPVPVSVILSVMCDVCDGLSAAHRATDVSGKPLSIVHRDVAPANILVTDSGLAKVIDFGIALSAGRIAGKTSPGVVRGRVAYLSPERILAGPTDHRADQWSVGVTLYEVLTRTQLFRRDTLSETLRAILEFQGAFPQPVPEPLLPSLVRMLSNDPNDRFQNLSEVRSELEFAARALRVPVSRTVVTNFLAGTHVGQTAKVDVSDAQDDFLKKRRTKRWALVVALALATGSSALFLAKSPPRPLSPTLEPRPVMPPPSVARTEVPDAGQPIVPTVVEPVLPGVRDAGLRAKKPKHKSPLDVIQPLD
jgi:serine/threonine protein kinase